MGYMTRVRAMEKQATFLRHLKQTPKVRKEVKALFDRLHRVQSKEYRQPIFGFKSKTGKSIRKIERRELGKTGWLKLVGIKPVKADYKSVMPRQRFKAEARW